MKIYQKFSNVTHLILLMVGNFYRIKSPTSSTSVNSAVDMSNSIMKDGYKYPML